MRVNSAAVWKFAIALAGGIAGEWIKLPYTIQTLLTFMALDILSGLFAAIATRSVNSSIMLRGIFKKAAVFPLLVMLHYAEKPLNIPFEFESLAAIAFIVYEAMSIVENCATAGAPVPAAIVAALAKAKVPVATPEQIHREFDQTTMTVNKSSEIIKTPDGQPDLKVSTDRTTVEEKHVERVAQKP